MLNLYFVRIKISALLLTWCGVKKCKEHRNLNAHLELLMNHLFLQKGLGLLNPKIRITIT